MKIAENLIELIGNTPLVQINRLNASKAQVVAKLEYFNPANSVKDRVAACLIEVAERQGLIAPGKTTLIEPTSGNMGIGLAFVAAIKGYRLILTMSEAMSVEKRKLLKAYGAKLVLTEMAKGMSGAVRKAEELLKEIPNSFMPQQFTNKANVEIHQKTTAEEIWRDTDGKVDILVSGVGSGGTITGVASVLKKKNPNFKAIAVEPKESPLLGSGRHGLHKIQGIGSNFIPAILDRSLIDEVFHVSCEEAVWAARAMALQEGILGGISSGAACFAALEVAKRAENDEKLIVFVLPSCGERYLSSVLFEHIASDTL